MTKQALGIDIGDGRITAVELKRQGKGLALTACHSLPYAVNTDLAEQLRQLFTLLGRPVEICVCGLPLSQVCVRNLTLPFKDAKSIAQTLPFELEEQLITPVDRLITDFSQVEAIDSGSRIIAFAVEKTFLGRVLEGMQGQADPDPVMPSAVALAARVAGSNRQKRPLLLLNLEAQSLTMVLLAGETPVLYRRLPYPEQLLLPDPAATAQTATVDVEEAGETFVEGVRQLCDAIERSIDFFRLENGAPFQPEALVPAGLAVLQPALAARIGAQLGLAVEPPDLLAEASVECTDEALQQLWRDQPCDVALALALQGMGRKAAINFRKAEFARKLSLYAARKQVAAAVAAAAVVVACLLGYLWFDYRQMYSRDRALKEEMATIYKQTFPSVTRVVEPMAEMQAAMKGVQGSGTSSPLAVTDRRVLNLLADISARIPAAVSVQVGRLSIDHESVLMKGTTDTFNAVETIKSSLAASPRFSEVKIVSATADKGKGKNGGFIRFELQLQLRGV